ncbi:MAG: phosphoenolpyruvate--protein phosphotransferase [Anaerolineae bacterium]|jgi:phosphocarrier protein FPr|nr:phosphoenolpyruvate--protein phosphotransferase [Anaerolineae bacterium]MBT4459033.1 phosphoenolpyruvate--protein phosphotransferase [Anaerolineae bacterium]MBT6323282.1 phosphoenolpyruvate--protein phosphotransferase [Anaerolineae bacterium]MBT6811357.1 phosphoenolpyruvate--protein phosphotransferase [Anaerolineae bacterium]MBT7017806.1 phosphoenolpyruvate--protein phosphotransferase [Anaerolineae bacterium]
MKQLEIVIQNPTGLHARPAKIFVNLAKQYQSDIRVFHGEKKANAKSLISMLTLGVQSGSGIRIEVEGEDEDAAIVAIEEAIAGGLGEEELIEQVATETETAQGEEKPIKGKQAQNESDAPLPENMIQGIAGAPGIAIGPIYHLKRTEIKVEETFESESEEKNQLQEAIEKAKGQVMRLHAQMLAQNASSEAAIFDVHLELLDDVELLDAVLEKINQKQSAAFAWQTTIDARAEMVAGLDDPLLAARAADLHDVGYRVLRILVGVDGPAIRFPDHPVIVVADDLSPSDTVSLDRDKVLGFCTASGGPTAHTAIIARALSLPAIVSAGERILTLGDGPTVILNGDTGLLTLDPTEDEIAQAKSLQQAGQKLRHEAQQKATDPAVTVDGHRVEIVANIGGVAGAQDAMKSGAEGVGLLRTEFLFLERISPPTEEEQFAVYRDIAKTMQGLPIIVRTLDVGGDKPLPYIKMPEEANPFLGVRGIRLCMARPEILREQIRAVLRATKYGKLRIMFPMVSDLSEWHEARALVEEVRAELGTDPVEMGIMIEVPSAAVMADVFAEHVDFFSVGTNDLTQYTLAMDRMHPQLAGKSDGLHPAVLRLINTTVQAAHKAGKWVGVCGELGADPEAVPILVGLGVDELSVTVPAIPTVKAQVRVLKYEEAQILAKKALSCGTASEVRELV